MLLHQQRIGDRPKMSLSEDTYRDACRRLHRIIANFFAVKAWCRGVDCVILDRKVLNELLTLERIKTVRVEWMRQDMKRWFPYVHSLQYAEKDSVGSLYMSRVPIEDSMSGQMTDNQRAKKMAESGIKALVFSDPSKLDCSDSGMITELTRIWPFESSARSDDSS